MRPIAQIILLYACICGARLDAEEVKPIASPAEQLVILQKEYEEDQAAFSKAADSLADSPEAELKLHEFAERFEMQRTGLFTAAMRLAQENPESKIGFTSLEWMLEMPTSYTVPPGAPFLKLMCRQYATNSQIGKGIAVLAYYLPMTNDPSFQPAVELLNAVAQQNPDRVARGQAALGLAYLAKREFQSAERDGSRDANHLATKAESAFETVVRSYADCPNLRRAHFTLGDEAGAALYQLRYLRIGLVAPEIEGEDLNGARLKLSDYRGKVILLVFWASWCSSCMEDVAREKTLLEHFRGQPFAVVGVNGDNSKLRAQKAVLDYQIPWRSFWDGDKGSEGPIAVSWDLQAWPTCYILDQNGVISLGDFHGVSWLKAQATIEKLVSAAGRQ